MELLAVAFLGMIAGYFVMGLTTPQQKMKPASLQEFDFPQVEEGKPQGVLFGDAWTQSWFVLYYGNMRTKKVKSKGSKK